MARARQRAPEVKQPEPKPQAAAQKLLAESGRYAIKKFGLYAYQVVRLDPSTSEETLIGEPNVFGVVASDLVDRIFNDINPQK